MGQGKLLRQLNRTKLELPHLTRALRQTGQLEPDGSAVITIRKVKVGEVTALVDTPPRLLAVRRQRAEIDKQREGEGLEPITDEDWSPKLEAILEEDQDLMRATTRYNSELQRAIIQLGVVSEKVVLNPELVTEEGDEILPEDFGDDFEAVYNGIVEWSSLPYARLSATFLDVEVADPPESDGEVLQETPA